MNRTLALLYGALAYIIFIAAFTWAILWTGNLWVPKTIDSGLPGPVGSSLLINLEHRDEESEARADLRVMVVLGGLVIAAMGAAFLSHPAYDGLLAAACVGPVLAVTAFGVTTSTGYVLAGQVNWLVAGLFVAGGFGGGFIGTKAAARLGAHREAMTVFFAGLIVLVALYTLYRGLTG